MEKTTRLHVGCGYQILPGYINCDLYANPGVDVVFDLQQGWPFESDSADNILASHVLEHLSNPMAFFREAWRVLKPGGMVALYLPYGASDLGMIDPTHVRYWLPLSFASLLPNYARDIGNPQHNGHECYFAPMFVGAKVHPKFHWMCHWPWRHFFLDWLWFLWSGHVEMIVNLKAIKTEEDARPFNLPDSNIIPVSQCMYKHDYEHRKLRPDEDMTLLCFSVSYQQVKMFSRPT